MYVVDVAVGTDPRLILTLGLLLATARLAWGAFCTFVWLVLRLAF